jgi:O-antigen/teichoic acid export membrane protein
MNSQVHARGTGVLRSTVANWAAFLFAAVVSFFLSPFVVHRLGNSGYGIWVLLGSFVGYLGLLDFGVRGAVTRFVAASHATGNHREASVTVVAALRLFGFLAALAIVLAAIAALAMPQLFRIPPQLLSESRWVLFLGGITVASAFIGGVFGGVVAGLHRFDIDAVIEITTTAIRAVALVVALQAGYGLVALSVIQLVISVMRGTAAFIVVRRLYPQLVLRGAGPTGPALRQLLSFSLFASLIHFSGLLIYQTDTLVIGAFLPIGVVTYYAIASNLGEYARQLVSALSRIVQPRASAADAAGGSASVRDMFMTIAPRATLLTVPIALTFLLRGERFISLWMGPEYAPQAGAVLSILAIGVWFAGGRMIVTATIMGMNRHRPLAAAFAAEAVANLVLSIALIRGLGLPGVAIGAIAPSIAVTLGFMPIFLRRELNVRVDQYLFRVFVVPSLACAAFGAGTYFVERWLPTESMAVFFLQTALLVPLVVPGALLLVFSREERRALIDRLRSLRPGSRGSASPSVDIPAVPGSPVAPYLSAALADRSHHTGRAMASSRSAYAVESAPRPRDPVQPSDPLASGESPRPAALDAPL